MLTTRGLGVVLADLSKMGFDAKWGVVSAADVGANHQRERIWIRAKTNVAYSKSCGSGRNTGKLSAQDEQQTKKRQKGRVWQSDNAGQSIGEMADTSSTRLQRYGNARINAKSISKQRFTWGGFDRRSNSWWEVEPNISRVADGVAARVDRLKAIGNGQVPSVAATAWELLR